jgi:ribose 5-phosphate isomerase A
MSATAGLEAAAEAALALISDGARVGLGTGRAAAAFITWLGARARAGLVVSCVATSEASARLARAHGLRLVDLDEQHLLDVTVDGADEVGPDLSLVKGRGGRVRARADRGGGVAAAGDRGRPGEAGRRAG